MKYRLINNIVGWIVFAISATVFLMTIEPTASFWDCGEFIATAIKLQVGHPPGAPLFMILARFFSLFAPDPTHIPVMVNSFSALSSAFTILFLFWTITHFAKKIIASDNELNLGKTIAIMGSGIVGALAYSFSDTFWFSAVEGEVYASSSLFTAVVFWLIIKWENRFNEKHANRWLILIAYMMGLSIGVHLLNLLAIPAIVFVFYFKKFKVTKKGIIAASAISILSLGIIMYGIIPGFVEVASWFELLFVNSFGLPYNSGVLFYAVLVIGLLVFGIHYTHKKRAVIFNTIILIVTVIIIGYSSFAMIVIRSLANPVMDENNPENVFSLLSYLNREQYGDRPLVYGQYFNAPLDHTNPIAKGDPVYIQRDGKYVVTDYKQSYNYDQKFCTVFPRMWSSEANHIRAYKSWADIKGVPINTVNNQGQVEKIYKPTFGENLKYFFKYQLGHMYFRYFMWNFAGRQNDIQGHGSILYGNWLSGINFIDEARLGPQKDLPDNLKNNKGRNVYYMLPLLLGLLGLIFQFKRGNKDFWVTMLLFFFTGIAIVIYLNQYPYQPRERDYAYAGSFYAFAIWIGLGVLALYDFLSKKLPAPIVAAGVTIISFVAVPYLMVAQNWDDHDRSNRYTARDFAKNYLNSCAPNSIIFTNGDNDTFPLWYAQEVEGVRTDIRVVNLSLFNTDWYIDQMKRKAYDSDPIPLSLNANQYVQGKRDYLPVYDQIKQGVDVKEAMRFIASDIPETKLKMQNGESMDYLPSKTLKLSVDPLKIINNGSLKVSDTNRIEKQIQWSINKNYILKSEMMLLDLLSTNDWNRPVYFAITVGSDSYLNLDSYFRLDGLAYRFVPIKTNNPDGQTGYIDTDILYDNLMNKFVWGNISDPNVYLDENNLRMTMNLRNNFSRLAGALLDEGKRDSAVTVLDRCMEIMPNESVPYNVFVLGIAEGYYRAGLDDKANAIIEKMYQMSTQELNYYLGLDKKFTPSVESETKRAMAVVQEILRLTRQYKQTELSKQYEETFGDYYQKFMSTYTL